MRKRKNHANLNSFASLPSFNRPVFANIDRTRCLGDLEAEFNSLIDCSLNFDSPNDVQKCSCSADIGAQMQQSSVDCNSADFSGFTDDCR